MTTGSWDKNLPSASRFTILTEFNNEVVRDKMPVSSGKGLPGLDEHVFKERCPPTVPTKRSVVRSGMETASQ